MEKTKLIEYLQLIHPMPNNIAIQLTENFEYHTIEKQSFLIKESSRIPKTFFIETGYVRSFTIDQTGRKVTTHIYSSPCFVNDFSSFFKRWPAKQNFQTITDCSLFTMSLEQVELYFHSNSEFREFGRLLILDHYDQLNERMLGMIKDTAEIRYKKLLQKHPDVFQFVPLKIIASYLGITDTSLSRIRKDILRRWFLVIWQDKTQ